MKKLTVVLLLVLGIVTFKHTQIEDEIMALTNSTFELLTKFEGKRNRAYKDTRGLWTIGVGHLIKPNEQHLINAVLTDAQVEDLFKSDLKWCDDAITSSVRVSLTQNQYDALTSLCYNIGDTNFKRSSLVRVLNTGDYKTAAQHFMDWVTPSVLIPRRKQEKALFLQDI